MIGQPNGGMRPPGPHGLLPGGPVGRPPGTLGLASVVLMAPVAVAKAVVKSTTMPEPTRTSTTLQARAVTWDLFKKDPVPTQVTQGELATCPIAAILAAMAHTAWGKGRIRDLVSEVQAKGAVETVLSKATLKQLTRKDIDEQPQPPKIVSDRYFTVKIKDPPVEVSDVLYVGYTDGSELDPVYMQQRPLANPRAAAEVLWPAVIEKAYAAQIGDYETLDNYGPGGTPSGAYWEVLAGSKPQVLAIGPKTDVSKIKAIAVAAAKSPAIGATRATATKVLSEHGFAILGMAGAKIDLYDPHGQEVKLSLDDFLTEFEQILYKA